VWFFQEFLRVLQLRHFLAQNLAYFGGNDGYPVSQMMLTLVSPSILRLDSIEATSGLRCNGSLQYLTGLPSFPDPRTLGRFLRNGRACAWEHLHRAKDRLLQRFIRLPERRSYLIFDPDRRVVTVFKNQDGAQVGYNPKYRRRRSYNPSLCLEAKNSFL